MSLPFAPKSGTKNVRKPATASGTQPQRRKGRNFPQRVLVRSESMPISGSKNASLKRLSPIIVPAASAVIPKMSV